MQFKRAIDDIERTQLSPNLVEVNKHLQKTKNSLDLRQDDSKYYQTTMGGQNSPKRLKLGDRSRSRIEESFDAEKLMVSGQDRYLFARTTRNKEASPKNKHPPKLSPRSTNKSVDPIVRKNNLLSKVPMKTAAGFGQEARNALSTKKQSAQLLQGSLDQSRLTSKYGNFPSGDQQQTLDVDFVNMHSQRDPVVVNKKKLLKSGTNASSKRSTGGHSPSNDKGEEGQTSGANFNFSRLQGQNVTGFTHDTIETNPIQPPK